VEKVLFTEEQRFTQKWLWLIIIGATLIALVPTIYGIYSQEILGEPWGNNPTDTRSLYIILFFELILMGGIILLIYKMRLKVEIKSDGFWFSFPPLARKWRFIKKEEIAGFEVRKYSPVKEYGGWGIRGSRRNRAYNISGNVGVQLLLKNGRKVLFGTQESQAIEYAMKKMMNSERLN
jgi:hypothetical protein